MTAIGITVVTLAFPNPDADGDFTQDEFNQVNTTLSFSLVENNKIRTLSTTDVPAGSDLSGLLFTPEPDPSYVCTNSSLYVPTNATKVVLPRSTFGYTALAPWISPNCTLAYLKAVQGEPMRSFIFYLPDNGTDPPPLANDPAWGLGDGGRWKSSNKYPVYAIPGATGNKIISELALYASNLTSVPNGHQLASEYPPSDYIRLAVDISLTDDDNLPSLWVFLLIVLAILIVIIGSTSFLMHWVQRKRRDRLRRLVASGVVDLEALGIKRLTVPQDVLDKMPLYTYAADTASSRSPAADALSTPRSADGSAPLEGDSVSASRPRSFSQPTCAICLDDFVNHESQVRELPCRHIFHPDCIDSFLRENSSLCPMCKKTVLPRGYCPAVVTNAMVRRERMIRRIRDRVPREQEARPSADTSPSRRRLRSAISLSAAARRRAFSGSTTSPANVEMTRTDATQTIPTTTQPTVPQPADHPPAGPPPPAPNESQSRTAQSRREWARQRALAMIGNGTTAGEATLDAEERRVPRWRKVVGKVWPGLV